MATGSDEPVATLPSGEPVDAPAAPASKGAPVVALLAGGPSRVDAFVSHLYRCLQTRADADVVLLFLCYTSRLGGSVLETLSRPLLRQSARRFVAMAWKLPPATTVVLSATAPQPPLAALVLRLGGRLKALSALLSETRTMGRLWGLLGLYFAAKRLVGKSWRPKGAGEEARSSTVDAAVAYGQMASLISFQAAENVAYLSSKRVLPLSPAAQDRLSLLSVRCWGLYVGLELGRLAAERWRKVSGGEAVEDVEWAADWHKSFTRNLSWAPLTVHWGMRHGPLPDIAVSLLAAYPSVGSMMDLWRETA